MTLIDFVKYFRKGGKFEQFCIDHLLDFESEVIEIYMKKPFHIENEIAFFEIEKTEGDARFFCNGEFFYNFFDFFYFEDVIDESNSGAIINLNDEDIARILYSYGINDA